MTSKTYFVLSEDFFEGSTGNKWANFYNKEDRIPLKLTKIDSKSQCVSVSVG